MKDDQRETGPREKYKVLGESHLTGCCSVWIKEKGNAGSLNDSDILVAEIWVTAVLRYLIVLLVFISISANIKRLNMQMNDSHIISDCSTLTHILGSDQPGKSNQDLWRDRLRNWGLARWQPAAPVSTPNSNSTPTRENQRCSPNQTHSLHLVRLPPASSCQQPPIGTYEHSPVSALKPPCPGPAFEFPQSEGRCLTPLR